MNNIKIYNNYNIKKTDQVVVIFCQDINFMDIYVNLKTQCREVLFLRMFYSVILYNVKILGINK